MLSLNYTSTKFIYVYHFLSLKRIENDFSINQKRVFPVKVPYYTFYELDKENFTFSSILASLDNNGQSIYSGDPAIYSLSEDWIDFVEDRILTTFYSKDELHRELEQYLYKCTLRKALNYDFYDNKLDDVKKEFSFLYQLSEYIYLQKIKNQIVLDERQISTVTLLFREHVLKNKIAGRNCDHYKFCQRKERLFSQRLLYHFDTRIAGILNIDELHKLKLLKFDNLITFSNRISTILLENGFLNIKVNYYFHASDIEFLSKLGFSSNSHRKLLAKNFTQEVQNILHEKLIDYLKTTYPNFFV
ncbi:hypothetical protein [Enterococcus olivae]